MSQKQSITDKLKHALHLDRKSGASSPSSSDEERTGAAGTSGAVGAGAVGAGAASTAGLSAANDAANTTSSGGGAKTIVTSTSNTQYLQTRGSLKSSEAHWEAAEAAMEEARRQAKLVEEGARSHREAYEEYFRAERDVKTARHTVEEIETRIRNLGLENKQAQLAAAKAAYDQERSRLAGLSSDADRLRAAADAAQGDADAKGHELESRVAESKLHSDRLAELEAALLEARAAEAEARERHTTHLADLEPLRNKHRHHQAERARLADALAKLQAELDDLARREAQAVRDLQARESQYDGLTAEVADLEALAANKEREVATLRSDADSLTAQREQLLALLGQDRNQVAQMTKDTQETMALAQQQAADADARAAELQRHKDALAGAETAAVGSRDALSAAVAQQRELEGAAANAATSVEDHAQRASALEAELRAAKEKVDLAQARKEELWELAKAEGGAGDRISDTHYVENIAKPAGEDPTPMITKSQVTDEVAGKIPFGEGKVLHHQKEIA